MTIYGKFLYDSLWLCFWPGAQLFWYDFGRILIIKLLFLDSITGENRQLWNKIADEICKNADKLYRMIAEAFGILSEPTKRYVYDLKEERRNA
ncbi:hypothetical protein CsSME_00023946 [Camellia sinensis var. sinensis]